MTSKKYVNKATPCDCADDTGQGGFSCDLLELVSTDKTVDIKKIPNNAGKCAYNLRVAAVNVTFVKADSPTTQWEGNGTTTPYKLNVRLSTDDDNLLTFGSDGALYVDATNIVETPNSEIESPTILISLDGTASRQIRADLKLSDDAGQALEVRGDGLYAPLSGIAFHAFVPGDVGYPAPGATAWASSTLTGKRVIAFRGGLLQPLTNLGDGGSFITKPLNSDTITFSHALLATDYIVIIGF